MALESDREAVKALAFDAPRLSRRAVLSGSAMLAAGSMLPFSPLDAGASVATPPPWSDPPDWKPSLLEPMLA